MSTKLNVSPFSPETKTDILSKRAFFFNSVHQIQQKFGSYDPKLILKLVSVYSTALYGSSVWQLDSEEHKKLCRSWNTAVKIIWDLPFATHKRFLEDMCPVPHLESLLYSRFIGFAHSLLNSNKSILKILFTYCASNWESVTGRNLYHLSRRFECRNLSELWASQKKIQRSRVYYIQEDEKWKIGVVEELSRVKKNLLDIEFDEDYLDEIFDYLCLD